MGQMKLTAKGATKVARSQVGGPMFAPATIVFGDGGAGGAGLPYTIYEPTGQETALKREVFRIEAATVDRPNDGPEVIVSGYMVAAVGDFWVTEIGILDHDGDLVAIGRTAVFQKLSTASDAYDDIAIELVLGVGTNAVVQVTLDVSQVLATRKWVSDNFPTKPLPLFFYGLM